MTVCFWVSLCTDFQLPSQLWRDFTTFLGTLLLPVYYACDWVALAGHLYHLFGFLGTLFHTWFTCGLSVCLFVSSIISLFGNECAETCCLSAASLPFPPPGPPRLCPSSLLPAFLLLYHSLVSSAKSTPTKQPTVSSPPHSEEHYLAYTHTMALPTRYSLHCWREPWEMTSMCFSYSLFLPVSLHLVPHDIESGRNIAWS